MARETSLSRKRRENGKNWVNTTKPDELVRMAENILTDIAYGNVNSVEDKWDLVSPPVLNALNVFCTNRYNNLNYITRCIESVRLYNAAFSETGLDNAMYAVIYENINRSCELYANIITLVQGYMYTQDPTCMLKLYSLFDDAHKSNRNLIQPNRFI